MLPDADVDLLKTFIDVGVFKFGDFVLKSGVKSPVYVDLRCIIAYPSLLKKIVAKLWNELNEIGLVVDLICGVPYTALPVATAVSIMHNIPLILKRKEAKGHGTKKILEGVFKVGQKCLIIEDTVSTGSSILETAEVLKAEGLQVTDCVVLIDRQQGGKENLETNGIRLIPLFQMQDIISTLIEKDMLPVQDIERLKSYFDAVKVIVAPSRKEVKNVKFSERAQGAPNAVLKELFAIMDTKHTNLCVSVDVQSSEELIRIADAVGPHICILKTHIDMLSDFSEPLIFSLKNLARKHDFLIMEDRKFSDIGNTVVLQYRSGTYRIHDWADIVTVHSIPGESIVKALKMASLNNRACVLVAQMSSEGALTSDTYASQTLDIAENHSDFVIGLISQSRLTDKPSFVHISPGVNFEASGDGLGQQYRSPEKAIKDDGVDLIIVGRGIIKAASVEQAAIQFKNRAYKAYMDTVVS